CYAPGLEFISGFLGCLYARVVAVPVYPPGNERGLARLFSVIQDCEAKAILTDGKGLKRLEANEGFAGLRWINTQSLETNSRENCNASLPTESEIAFLQYTSGSTGTPKG